MRLIEVQPDVTIKIGDQNKVFKFKEFLSESLDIYTPIGKSRKMMRQANKIDDAILEGNGTIKLEDADYEVLKSAMHVTDDDTAVWNPMLRKLERAGWFEAVEKAQEVKA